MKKLRYIIVLICLLFICSSCQVEKVEDLSHWKGGYYYGIGVAPKASVDYWITIDSDENGNYTGFIGGSGWMYGLGAKVRVIGDAHSVDLVLDSYIFEMYESNEIGDTLLSLTLNDDGTIYTEWVELVPSLNINREREVIRNGICFEKATDEKKLPSPGISDDIGWKNEWSE